MLVSPFLTIIERCLLILVELANVRYHDSAQDLTSYHMQMDGHSESNRCLFTAFGFECTKNGQSK